MELSILGWIRAVLHGSGVCAILSFYATAIFLVANLDSGKLSALSNAISQFIRLECHDFGHRGSI